MLLTYKELFFKGMTRAGIATTFCGMIGGLLSWVYVLPEPDKGRGFVYALNNHGTLVYVTAAQFLANKYAFLIFAAGIAMVVLGRLARGVNVAGKWKD